MDPQQPTEQPQPQQSPQPETKSANQIPQPQSSPEQPAVPAETSQMAQPQTALAQTMPAYQQPKPNNKPLLLAIAAAFVITVIVAGFLLLKNSKNNNQQTPKTSTNASTTLDDESKSSQTSEQSENTSITTQETASDMISLNKSIVDEELGYTIKAVNMSIGQLSIPAKYQSMNSNNTVVLVQYTASKNSKYTGSPKYLTLSLIGADSKVVTATTLSDEDIKAKGLTPFESATVTADTVTGYKAYWMSKEAASSITLRYKRPGVTIVSTSQTIPAKDFDIVLR